MTPETRRRGVDLEDAIYAATLTELAEQSMRGLTFELIAARAGAGKASLYRRWRNTDQLVLAALARSEDRAERGPLPAGTRMDATGDLRQELIAYLDDLAAGFTTPVGQVLPSLLLERDRRPDLWRRVIELLVEPRQRLITEALQRAAERGEMDPAAITAARAGSGPALLLARHLTIGPQQHADVVTIVDEVLLPTLQTEDVN